MYYVLQTFNTKSFQVVQSTRKAFASFYGKVLFECEEETLASNVLRSFQQSHPSISYSRFSIAQLDKIKKARRRLHANN